MARIIKNSIRCLECKTVIESTHHHDFVFCQCPEPSETRCAVDGGTAYLRRYGNGSWEELSEYIYTSKEISDLVESSTKKMTETLSQLIDLNSEYIDEVRKWKGVAGDLYNGLQGKFDLLIEAAARYELLVNKWVIREAHSEPDWADYNNENS